MPEISQLPVGYELTPVRYQLQPEEVDLYLRAVEEPNPLFGPGGVTPPTTLAAYALKGILMEMELPAGAVHAAQDLSFTGAVALEAVITFQARVAQNAVRRGWRFLAIDFSGTDEDGVQVIEGRSTVLIPEEQAGG